MTSRKRDDFNVNVVRTLKERVNNFCSNPKCRCSTTGPNAENSKSTHIGTAAHITAAAPGGPRYDAALTAAQRSSAENGIWLCNICARRVDVDSKLFPSELLREWKMLAEAEADVILGKPRQTILTEHVLDKIESSAYNCPHCHTAFAEGQTICKGCHGQILWGATIEERKAAMSAGAMFVGFFFLWLYAKLEIKLFALNNGTMDMLPLIIAATMAFGAGFVCLELTERYYRSRKPRVFVQILV